MKDLEAVRAIVHPGRMTEARHCLACGRSTRGGKPYCTRHLGRHPYAARVAEQVDQQAREAAGGPISRTGTAYASMRVALAWVSGGTPHRLCREAGLSLDHARRVLAAMVEDGIVQSAPCRAGKLYTLRG